MSTQHTPGPWEVWAPHPSDGEMFGVRTADPATAAESPAHRSTARAMGRTDGERAANARLIAAAPEMYEVISDAERQLACVGDILATAGYHVRGLLVDMLVSRMSNLLDKAKPDDDRLPSQQPRDPG